MYFGKNGSDAVFKAFQIICRQLAKYGTKLQAAIDQAVTDGKITNGQAATAIAFLGTATALCAIFELVSQNSGFTE